MATGIFALLDDIAVLADDIAITTKIATKKTASILTDDLAVNAEKATGFKQDRELKVIGAITKGSLLNKLIIIPIIFILNFYLPSLIPYILIIGGLYLLFEGTEKIYEYLFHKSIHTDQTEALSDSTSDNILEIENNKIKSAIKTDFILSIEIVVLTLSTMLDKTLINQIISTSLVALIATFGVYGIVALIVRIDNVGFWFIKKERYKIGNSLISLMPKLIKFLSFVGTFAMLLVGGSIILHNVSFLHHFILDDFPLLFQELIFGLIIGSIVLLIVNFIKKI